MLVKIIPMTCAYVQGTGLLAVQKLGERQESFRIVATGVVLEMDKSTQILKKLKLTGEPYKIFKKTAFIKVRMTINTCSYM